MKTTKEEAEKNYIPTSKAILETARIINSVYRPGSTYIDEMKSLIFAVASVIAAHNLDKEDLEKREILKKEFMEFFVSSIEVCSIEFDKNKKEDQNKKISDLLR